MCPEYGLLTVEILRQDIFQVKQLALETKQTAKQFDPECRGCGQAIHSAALLDCRHPICFTCVSPSVTDSRSIRCQKCPASAVLAKDFERHCIEEKPLPSLRTLTQASSASDQQPAVRSRSDQEKLRVMLGFEDFSDSVSEVRSD